MGMGGNDLLPNLMNLKKTEAQVNHVLNPGHNSKITWLFEQ